MARRSEEVQGDPRAPQSVAEFLLRVGGKNPFGDPNYRLVHTSNRFHLQGGAWKDWDENLSLQQRGGMVQDTETGLMVPSQYKPNSIVVEMRWSKRYCNGFDGWLLERWMPASHYGSRDVWHHLHLPNRPEILLLGPYPDEGDYECCSSIEPEMPALEKLHEAIKFQTYVQDNILRGDVQQAVLERVAEAASQYEKEQEAASLENEYRIKEFLSPWTSGSLEAGRWRNKMAAQAGVKEHA